MEIPCEAQPTPPPSPDVWDMPSTPPSNPNDLSCRYPLPRTPTPERFPHLDFSRLLDSPITASGSLNQQFYGAHCGENVHLHDVFDFSFSHASTARGKYIPPNTATFGQDRENQLQKMKIGKLAPLVPIQRNSKVIQLGGDKIVESEVSSSFQVINETEHRSLDAMSRKRFQVAYDNIEGTFYASNDAVEPVEKLIRTRREEWREHVRNRLQMR